METENIFRRTKRYNSSDRPDLKPAINLFIFRGAVSYKRIFICYSIISVIFFPVSEMCRRQFNGIHYKLNF
jgi:hypothetical protein